MRIIAATVAGLGLLLAASTSSAGGAGSGSFAGLSDHVTRGTVEVVKTADGWEIHLKDTFWFDGAPDPRVGFGRSGKFVAPTDFEPLRSNSGAQVYKVPASIDPEDFDEVYIWCRKYSVPLGVAKIN